MVCLSALVFPSLVPQARFLVVTNGRGGDSRSPYGGSPSTLRYVRACTHLPAYPRYLQLVLHMCIPTYILRSYGQAGMLCVCVCVCARVCVSMF